ncbi:acyltransferase [Paenibacillus whitsoniae]|uniref:Acyltransferase n=2 Tax=Paenibacillus whitsoniae TaxID=2496558 RepID=A0A3S0BTF7_9BACL|nr:acyltransferase [Paenibacillus whitsoniae]
MNTYPRLFEIKESAILMPNILFRFDVPRENDKCVFIGEDCIINCQFIFESRDGCIKIGNRSFINGGTRLISRTQITIGNDVTIAWGCTIYDHDSHSLNWEARVEDMKQQLADYRSGNNMVLNKNWDTVNSKPITIEDKVWIGFDSVILKGVTIGEGAVVGAKSVVTKDVEPWTVVAGNPARVIKRIDQERK